MKQLEQVKEFNKAFNLPLDVDKVEKKEIELRKNLLLEELGEYWEGVQKFIHSEEKQFPYEARKHAIKEILDALIDIKYVLYGVYVYYGYEIDSEFQYDNKNVIGMMDYNQSFNLYKNIEETIQSIDYEKDNMNTLKRINNTVNLLLSEHGLLHLFEVGFDEVHASNMSKLEDGKPIYREDGKVLKGKDYFKPNLKKVLGYE